MNEEGNASHNLRYGNTEYPMVSYNMILDFLSKYDILRQPKVCRREFMWFLAFTTKDGHPQDGSQVNDALTLYIAHADNAAALLSAHPNAFMILLCGDGDMTPIPPKACERAIVLRKKEPFSYFVFAMQTFFTRILMWENNLERIVLRKGTLDDLLTSSSEILGNFTFITDSNFNVIACTQYIDPPDDLHRRIIDFASFNTEMLGEDRIALPEKKFYIKEPSDLTPYYRLSYPIFLNHAYFGSLSMSCHRKGLSDGLKDSFLILARYVVTVCERIAYKQIHPNTPHYHFFVRLLDNVSMPDTYIHQQLEMTDIPIKHDLKLIVIEKGQLDRIDRMSEIMNAASNVCHGNCYCFPYRDYLLVLCYGAASDKSLSHTQSSKELSLAIYKQFGIPCGVSQLFEKITDIDLAYRQALIALGLKKTLDSEHLVMEPSEPQGIYFFESALLYYLVDPGEKDERFLRFIFSHTLVETLYREDLATGTNNVALLWLYLLYERNATKVAQKLFIHRNTVLYHIEKIEKTYDFDLSSSSIRERLLVDYKVFFLHRSNQSIEQIFATDIPQ